MKSIIAGLTGQTGAGKSTAAKIFLSNGAYVIDCDKTARDIVEPRKPALKKLCESFGYDILNADDTLNRRLLAQKAFKDSKSTQLLSSITEPFITQQVRNEIKLAQNAGYGIIIIDAPLLLSSPLKDDCEVIICVTAPLDERINRLLLRDNRTREEIKARISAQQPEQFYIENSDIIIDNSEQTAIEPQVLRVIEALNCKAQDKAE